MCLCLVRHLSVKYLEDVARLSVVFVLIWEFEIQFWFWYLLFVILHKFMYENILPSHKLSNHSDTKCVKMGLILYIYSKLVMGIFKIE
jgi:hypothetical protein